MALKPQKAAGNVYCEARMNAANSDYRFNSREKTAEMMNISSCQLMKYELGICKQIPPESVCVMAELYNAPELRSYYCHNQCPIGAIDVKQVDVESLEYITLNILDNMKKLELSKDRLVEIASDGKITEDEEVDFQNIIKHLDNIAKTAQTMKVYAEKELGKR